MEIYGLTGGIASGKSTVADIFRSFPIPVLDADAIYHSLITPKNNRPSALAKQIETHFPNILNSDHTLNRTALGLLIFGNTLAHQQARTQLGVLTHPAVKAEFARQVKRLEAQNHPYVIYDVPLLYEKGLEQEVDGVIVVWVPQELQITRLMQRNMLSRSDAELRISAQIPLDEKKAKADWVVDNSTTLTSTEQQVRELLLGFKKIA